MHLTILRHGETVWNLEKRMQGHLDSPLTALGRQQALESVERLRTEKFDVLVSSDLGRAVETAEIVAAALGLPYTEKLPAFREVDIGPMGGHTKPEFVALHPEYGDGAGGMVNPALHYIEGTERPEAIRARLLGGLRELLARYGDRRVLLVTHGAAMRVILSILNGSDTLATLAHGRKHVNGDFESFEVAALPED